MNPYILVSIPTYNEEHTIGLIIRKINEVMVTLRMSYSIQIVDDASQDMTPRIAEDMGMNVFRFETKVGLAQVFRKEMVLALKSKADIVVHIDADGQYCPKEIPKLLKWIFRGADLVIGSRFLGEIEYMPILNRFGNFVISHLVSFTTGLRISDSQSGFRVFTSSVAKLPIPTTFTYTQAQIIAAARFGFIINEIPISFYKRKYGSSRLLKNRIISGIRMLIDIKHAVSLFRKNQQLLL